MKCISCISFLSLHFYFSVLFVSLYMWIFFCILLKQFFKMIYQTNMPDFTFFEALNCSWDFPFMEFSFFLESLLYVLLFWILYSTINLNVLSSWSKLNGIKWRIIGILCRKNDLMKLIFKWLCLNNTNEVINDKFLECFMIESNYFFGLNGKYE